MNDTELLGTIKDVPARIGMMSLVGIMGEAPHAWGNYFALNSGQRVLNFWAENLRAANRKFNLGDVVRIIDYGDWCIIYDSRIPEDWYYNKLCFTGAGTPPLSVINEIYAILGDPTNEMEQFTDPKSYYEKRGQEYINVPGSDFYMIRTKVKEQPRKLQAQWTTGDIPRPLP